MKCKYHRYYRTTIFTDERLHNAIRAIAKLENKSINQVVIEALMIGLFEA